MQKILFPKNKRADEKIVDYFLELKGWDSQLKEFYIKNNIPKYNRFLSPARDLLSLFDGDLEKTKEYLEKVAKLADEKCLEEWGLEYALEKFLELK